MSESGLRIIDAPSQLEYEVKRSRFIALVEPLSHPDDMSALLEQHHVADANHHCWAWRVDDEYRFNDDGEPAGTAGRPILAALDGAGIARGAVIVRRFFGGVKLGAGGLVRAYGGSAAKALDAAHIRTLLPHVETRLQVPFEFTDPLMQLAGPYQLGDAPEYDTTGIELCVRVPSDTFDALCAELKNRTSGQLTVGKSHEVMA